MPFGDSSIFPGVVRNGWGMISRSSWMGRLS
jgi:hypothetical protein